MNLGGLQADLKGGSGGAEPPQGKELYVFIFGTKSDGQTYRNTSAEHGEALVLQSFHILLILDLHTSSLGG